MSSPNPLEKTKAEYGATIEKIKTESAVGIDAQYTHAIIIEFLQQINERLDRIETRLDRIKG